jgi:hypothetical protein
MATTELLQQAIRELEKLSPDDQDAIAARLLEEIEDERRWSARFAATTDEEWDRLAAAVREEIAAGDTTPLDEFLEGDLSKR